MTDAIASSATLVDQPRVSDNRSQPGVTRRSGTEMGEAPRGQGVTIENTGQYVREE